MELGQKIKTLREKKNLKQEDLGLAVGSKQPRTWGSQIESGKIRNLKNEHAIKLGRLLDVEPNYFYTDHVDRVEEPMMDPEKFRKDPLKEKESKKEIIYYLTEENRALLRENAYLKSLLLKHKIEVYNADTQNDTV
jgi:transcriptional regulator with XRE-family HTH domain